MKLLVFVWVVCLAGGAYFQLPLLGMGVAGAVTLVWLLGWLFQAWGD